MAAPRPCSFAAATILPTACQVVAAEDLYRRLVSRVDESLFWHKAAARKAGSLLPGALVDVGAVELT